MSKNSNSMWIENLADTIRSGWIEWEAEASMRSTSEQDDRVGEEYLHGCLVRAIEKSLPKRTGGDAPNQVHQEGFMEIGQTLDGFVAVQFHDPEWWLHLTPDEADNMAKLLIQKAKELRKGS